MSQKKKLPIFGVKNKAFPNSVDTPILVKNDYTFKIKVLILKDYYRDILKVSSLDRLDAERMFKIFKDQNKCTDDVPMKIELCDGQGRVLDYDFLPNEYSK